MKFQLSDDTFPTLALPRDRAEAIAREVEELVARTLELSDSFSAAGQQLDSNAWKLLKSKEKVRIFRSRRSHRSRRADKAAAAALAAHDSNSAIGAHVHNDAGALNRTWAEWSPTSSSSSESSYSSGPSFQRSEGTATTPSSSPAHPRSARHFMRQRMHKLLSSGSASSTSSTLSSQSSALHLTASSSNGSAGHEQSGVEDPRAPGDRAPVLVLTGQIGGTVEDVALGWQADTLPRWLQRDTFLNDELDSCQLLGTLHGPTPKEPFRFLGVKWGAQSFGKFASPRDFIFVEATGITSNAHGQSVCYHVRQSVELAGFRELLDCGLIRGYMSTCVTFRATDFDAVEFFGRALLDARGDMRRSVSCSLYAERLLSVADIVECALAQKLMWHAQQQTQQRPQRAGDRWTTSPKCENCHKSLNKFGTLVQSGGACHCCRRVRSVSAF
jgi:hypothetical protein